MVYSGGGDGIFSGDGDNNIGGGVGGGVCS